MKSAALAFSAVVSIYLVSGEGEQDPKLDRKFILKWSDFMVYSPYLEWSTGWIGNKEDRA